MSRSTEDVFEDHLKLRDKGDLETDLLRNYASDVVLLTSNSNMRGHDAIRLSAARLQEQLPRAQFVFVKKQVSQRYALLFWQARSARYSVLDGVDSFAIEDGKIVFQSIHYRLIEPGAVDLDIGAP